MRKEEVLNREDCIFCEIADKKVSSNIYYEDDDVVAFEDINPQAPSHILIIPKKHINRLTEVNDEDMPILGKMVNVAKKIAKEKEFDKEGFRLLNNEGKNGGQTIYHLHFHLLAGRRLMWPPG